METTLYRTPNEAISWESAEIWDCRRLETEILIDTGTLSGGTTRRVLPRNADSEATIQKEERAMRQQGFREFDGGELAALLISVGVDLCEIGIEEAH